MDTQEKSAGPAILARPAPAIGALEIDPGQRRASVGGEQLYLSEGEFALLAAVASEPGRLFTHAELGEVCFSGVARIERCAERLVRKLELRGMQGHLRCEPGVGLALEATTIQPGAR